MFTQTPNWGTSLPPLSIPIRSAGVVVSRRVPSLVWYRLKYELTRDGWLTTRYCDNLPVTQWTHSQLSVAVHRRYLANESVRRQLHNVLATYWLGLSNVSHPSQQNATSGSRDRPGSKVIVYDYDQPLMFDTDLAPGKPRYLLFFHRLCLVIFIHWSVSFIHTCG